MRPVAAGGGWKLAPGRGGRVGGGQLGGGSGRGSGAWFDRRAAAFDEHARRCIRCIRRRVRRHLGSRRDGHAPPSGGGVGVDPHRGVWVAIVVVLAVAIRIQWRRVDAGGGSSPLNRSPPPVLLGGSSQDEGGGEVAHHDVHVAKQLM